MLNVDERIYAKKKAFYKGRAKVSLSNFELNGSRPRTIREEHIDAIVETFKLEGYIRLNVDNFVKVLIYSDVLD